MLKKTIPWGFILLSNFLESQHKKSDKIFQYSENITVLAHYSSSRKGSAYFFQQMFFNRLYRSRHAFEHSKIEGLLRHSSVLGSDSSGSSRLVGNSSEDFPFYFYNLNSNMQFRNNHTTNKLIPSKINNLGLIGNRSSTTSGRSYQIRVGASFRGGSFQNFSRWGGLRMATLPLFSSIDSLYRNRVFSNNLTAKSQVGHMWGKSFSNISKIWNNSYREFSYWSKSVISSLVKMFSSMVFFIRTVWFRTTHLIRLALEPRTQTEYGVVGVNKLISTSSFSSSFIYSTEPTYSLATIAKWDDEYVDPSRLSKSPTSAKKRRFFNRKHFTLRIGLGVWGKKLWQFKKSRNFWNYVRSLYTYMFRAYKAHYAFQNRLDVFIVRFFCVRTILYARSLIKAGHVFVGSFNPRNPMYQVQRHGIVTLSKKALTWTSSNNRIFSSNYGNDQEEELKAVRRMQKTSALRYARQQKDLYMFGESKSFKYAMFYGDDLNVLAADSRKTKFFSLNYFYSQKVINSSWW